MTILAIDFMNLCHRARSGFLAGDFPVVYNFFRGFKALVTQFNPSHVYVALEGHPAKRHQLLGEYKANRKIEANDPKMAEMRKFFAQKDIIVDMLTKYFPVSVVRHPTSEADDTIANLACKASTAIDWTVVSSDTDFIQLLHGRPNIKLYNPVKKAYVEEPSYDYVLWKALRGDASDNIPGLPGCGDKTAQKLMLGPVDDLAVFLKQGKNAELFNRNIELITFMQWSHDEAMSMTSSAPAKDWDAVRASFESYGFKSMTNEESWQKFYSSFDKLWNC